MTFYIAATYLVGFKFGSFKGYKFHNLFIFLKDALTKNFLGTSEEIEQTPTFNILKKERPNNYKPCTTTIEIQRKNFYAKVITKALRKYVLQKRASREQNKSVKKACFDDED